jgi:hypothetical protein
MPEREEPATKEPAAAGLVERVAGTIEDTVRAAAQATARRLDELPGARIRRLRRMAREPLPYVYDVHPDARNAIPRQLGTRTIDVASIAGTAVGPARQRGMDFLPLKPFRSLNWQGRWQRVRGASERLVVLPPIDVVRFGNGYWVVDGHNRVAAALYNGQLAIDANVVELGPTDPTSLGEQVSLEATLEEHDQIKAALSRRTRGRSPDEPPVDRRPDGGSGDGGDRGGDDEQS